MRHEEKFEHEGKGTITLIHTTVTVNVAAFTIIDGTLSVLLVAQSGPTCPGRLALPGDKVHDEEDLEQCAKREVERLTCVRPGHVEQVHTYGDPDRDPRTRDVSTVYSTLVHRPKPSEGSGWLAIDEALDERLAFDHDSMLVRALDDVRTRIEETSIATTLLPEEFTLAELRAVYEAIWGCTLDRGNFARLAVLRRPGFLIDTGFVSTDQPCRPAALFIVDQHGPLSRPIRRPWLVDPTIPGPPFNGRG